MKEKLTILERKLKSDWNENLKHYDVEFPSGLQLIALLCLYEKLGEKLSQKEITDWFTSYGHSYNQQARHLAGKGWDLSSGNTRFTQGKINYSLKRDELMLNTVNSPNPLWNKDSLKRINNLGLTDWDDILEEFKDRGCAVCGRKFEQYDKGHLNRSLSYEKGNIVPMCTDCNNWGQAKDLDFTLNAKLIARPIL